MVLVVVVHETTSSFDVDDISLPHNSTLVYKEVVYFAT